MNIKKFQEEYKHMEKLIKQLKTLFAICYDKDMKNLRAGLAVIAAAAVILSVWVLINQSKVADNNSYIDSHDQISSEHQSINSNNMLISLPDPNLSSQTSLEKSIFERRSIREFSQKAMPLQQLGQLLWSAQGITDQANAYRAAPSAGALFPLKLYVAISNVDELADGIYQYLPAEHSLKQISPDRRQEEIAAAAANQQFLNDANLLLLIAADFDVTAARYGEKAGQYVFLEAGHAAQNILLQAVSLELGAVPIGAIDETRFKDIFNLDELEPVYLVAVGSKSR